MVVYKASSGGITAAIAAAQDGASVVLLEPTGHVGGISTQGGLTVADLGRFDLVGGLSHQFFDRVADYYKTTYGANSPQYHDCIQAGQVGGSYEPHVGEAVYEKMLAEQPRIRLIRHAVISAVTMDGPRIVSVSYPSGGQTAKVTGKVFIDASYTGDLMARAKIPYRVGTEASSEFGESLAPEKASPAIQAFNYRVTMTKNPADRLPIEKPEDYDPKNYDGILQRAQADPNPNQIFAPYWRIPNDKIDGNIADQPGVNWAYPDGDAATREKIEEQQRNYSLGWMYFLQNDPQVPPAIQKTAREFGLCKDEFVDSGNFPPEIYVREARRLNGAYLLKQSDETKEVTKPDSICLGYRTNDIHSSSVMRDASGKIRYLGGVYAAIPPFEVPYRCLTPKAEQCVNLLVPVCVSSTHIGWGPVRLEPMFLMMGEAAGRAAALAVAGGTSVQDIPISQLQARLLQHGAILHVPPVPLADFDWEPKQPKPGELVHFTARNVEGAAISTSWAWNFDGSGKVESTDSSPTFTFPQDKATIVTLAVKDASGKPSSPVAKIVPVGAGQIGDAQVNADDPTRVVRRFAEENNSTPLYYGAYHLSDTNLHKGQAFVAYTAALNLPGTYAVYITATGPARSKNALVEIDDAKGKESLRVDQNQHDPLFGLIHVGDFPFDPAKPARVTIRNDGAVGYVIFGSVRWVLQPGATP